MPRRCSRGITAGLPSLLVAGRAGPSLELAVDPGDHVVQRRHRSGTRCDRLVTRGSVPPAVVTPRAAASAASPTYPVVVSPARVAASAGSAYSVAVKRTWVRWWPGNEYRRDRAVTPGIVPGRPTRRRSGPDCRPRPGRAPARLPAPRP